MEVRAEPALGDVAVAAPDVQRRFFRTRLDPAEAVGWLGTSLVAHVAPVTLFITVSVVASFCGSVVLPPATPPKPPEHVLVKMVELRELEPPPPPPPVELAALGGGTRARGEEGVMGAVAIETLAVKKPKAKQAKAKGDRVRVARLEAIGDAQVFGIIGVLSSSGKQENALGGLIGSEIGDAQGFGGLGLSGVGTGGGGRGEGIGLGSIGTIGHGAGTGGRGTGRGYGIGSLGTAGPRVRQENISVSGALDRAVVGRILLSRAYRLRACYSTALSSRTGLSGKLGFRLQIDAAGKVSSVENTSAEQISEQALIDCTQHVLRELAFPAAPEGTTSVQINLSFVPS